MKKRVVLWACMFALFAGGAITGACETEHDGPKIELEFRQNGVLFQIGPEVSAWHSVKHDFRVLVYMPDEYPEYLPDAKEFKSLPPMSFRAEFDAPYYPSRLSFTGGGEPPINREDLKLRREYVNFWMHDVKPKDLERELEIQVYREVLERGIKLRCPQGCD